MYSTLGIREQPSLEPYSTWAPLAAEHNSGNTPVGGTVGQQEKNENGLAGASPLRRVENKTGGDDFQLTSSERRLIQNFRAMKGTARDMMLDLSEQYRRTLPAVPVSLRLLRTGE